METAGARFTLFLGVLEGLDDFQDLTPMSCVNSMSVGTLGADTRVCQVMAK